MWTESLRALKCLKPLSIEKEKLFGYNYFVCVKMTISILVTNGVGMVYKRKFVNLIAVFVIAMGLFLVGCGNKKAEVTSISIDKNGKVSNVIYEAFDQSYYNIQELSSVASSEISIYNNEYTEEKVSLESAELVKDNAFVKVTMNYNSAYDYAHFNHLTLFYGTVKEAIDNGYTVADHLVDKQGTAFGGNIEDYYDNHVVITTDKSNIITPFEITYMTEGVTLIDKKEAMLTSAAQDTVVLLLSK